MDDPGGSFAFVCSAISGDTEQNLEQILRHTYKYSVFVHVIFVI